MALGAILQAGASLASTAGSFFGQQSTNRANSAIAQKQMDFQREMSNTSYQRGMADMRAAGLNPILAYKTGGATVPTGASIAHQNPAANLNFERAASSAYALQQVKATTKNLEAETLNKEANTAKTLAETRRMVTHGDSVLGRQGDTLTKWWGNITNSAKASKTLQQSMDNIRSWMRKNDAKGFIKRSSTFRSPKQYFDQEKARQRRLGIRK